ncbi:TetR/AcrR family transcriptional regulator [Amycolatopsis minnesotensis]|uniref:TetR/AcrR family transcriptional regulator n=1 Tax=Amycolatopsis minnesotensis TaxID=337894 RepID=A0ABN2S454_9PSEU
MPKTPARDRVLDAYEEILIDTGPGTVTLEAVAAKAGVSKGGLLYHFGSKDALVDGLTKRLIALNDEDLERAKNADEGVVRYYLRTAVTDVTMNHALYRTNMAIIRLLIHEPKVADAARKCGQDWRDLLGEHIEDPMTAEVVSLVGDGLYLRAALGDPTESPLLRHVEEVLARLGA